MVDCISTMLFPRVSFIYSPIRRCTRPTASRAAGRSRTPPTPSLRFARRGNLPREGVRPPFEVVAWAWWLVLEQAAMIRGGGGSWVYARRGRHQHDMAVTRHKGVHRASLFFLRRGLACGDSGVPTDSLEQTHPLVLLISQWYDDAHTSDIHASSRGTGGGDESDKSECFSKGRIPPCTASTGRSRGPLG